MTTKIQSLWPWRPTIVLTLIFMALLPFGSSAQGMPVYDNTNFISMTKSLLESAKQTSELLKTVAFLKEQQDNIMKVNQAVKQLKAVREMARNNERMFQRVQNDLGDILGSPYIRSNEVRQVSDAFAAIVDMANEDLDLIEQILTSELLKMTDAERTAILLEKKARSKELLAELDNSCNRYREIISFRRMQDIINNRESTY